MQRLRTNHNLGTAITTRTAMATALSLVLVAISVSIASAHDMFVKPARFFALENTEVLVRVLNGTFSKSENSIARERVRDVSVVSPTGRARLDTSAWSAAGDTSTFRVRTAGTGTYVLGASTQPNVIALSAADFNLYLREDGIPDVLADRRRSGELERPAKERYHKHVKALIQVGSTRTDDFRTELGYPAELIPLSNPYSTGVGQVLRVRTLVDGTPTANQYVLYGGRTLDGARIVQRSVRSDSAGVASIPLRARGTWYVKFINMARLSGDTAADYESKWATITFQLR
jgi:uncharacterized GH25 family protein